MGSGIVLTPHFTLAELCESFEAARHGIENTPTSEVVSTLRRLCTEVLDPIRESLGVVAVNSGYRSPEVNRLVGGAPTSAHVDGRAADLRVIAPRRPPLEVVEWIAGSGLPFDQVIYEYGRWTHVAIPRFGQQPRQQILMIFDKRGYLPFDPAYVRRMAT